MPEKKKILIAEDEPQMRELLGMRLEVQGYEVTGAGDGEDAINKIKQDKPDLILLDLAMPKIDGFEVCRILKFDDNLKDIPIIVLSGLDQQQDREKAIQSGADAYFIKPFDLDLLLVKIKNLIG